LNYITDDLFIGYTGRSEKNYSYTAYLRQISVFYKFKPIVILEAHTNPISTD